MATASLIHARCCYSPRLHLKNGGHGHGHVGSSSHSSSSSSSSPPSSSDSCSSFNHRQGLTFSGINSTWKLKSLRAQAMSTTQGNAASPRGFMHGKHEPDHLLVLVHGILASPSDWTYAEAELKKRLGRNFLIYASSSNTYTKTFGGIDGAGKRLADEVMQVVQKTQSLKRISFLAHSLGGLFARYAIAVLYTPNTSSISQSDNLKNSKKANSQASCSSRRGMIAGLEPINFITLATPHLGVRGKKQLPFLLGVPILEKIAAPIAPIFAGRTGSQLFLTDELLWAHLAVAFFMLMSLTIVSTIYVYIIIIIIWSFKIFVWLFSLALEDWFPQHYPDMVGWRTSSIRRETELVKPPRRSLDGYKHVVDVEYCPPVLSDGPHFPPEAAKAKEAAQNAPSTQSTVEYHEILEEEMIHGLQQLGWKKVDVSFHSAFWPFFAHNNIHVKNEWLYNAGVGVVAHVAESLKQQESSTFIAANL